MKISHDSETPAQGQQVITACAFIHRYAEGQYQLFLPRRAETKKFLPGVFELPGGHIDYGEDMEEGLRREIYEEFGVHISIGDPFAAFTYNNPIKGSHSVEVIYFASLSNSEVEIQIHPEDHSEYRWISIRDIDEIQSAAKDENDPEIRATRKGFALLNGGAPDFL